MINKLLEVPPSTFPRYVFQDPCKLALGPIQKHTGLLIFTAGRITVLCTRNILNHFRRRNYLETSTGLPYFIIRFQNPVVQMFIVTLRLGFFYYHRKVYPQLLVVQPTIFDTNSQQLFPILI